QRWAAVVVTALLVDRVDTEAAARTLGGVHRDIRPAHQGIGVVGVLRKDRDADADVDVDRLVVDGEWGIDGLQELFRDHDGSRHIRRAPGDYRKLVAAIAGDRVGLAKHAAPPLSDL